MTNWLDWLRAKLDECRGALSLIGVGFAAAVILGLLFRVFRIAGGF